MRVLLTNNTLAWHAGSELYTRDVAVSLVRRGHQPIAYSSRLGPVADELRAASVPVIDDLAKLTVPPDVIHGQHHMETVAALLRFRGIPAVSVCHGWVPWEEIPAWHPRVWRYVGVSELLGERLVSSGIPADRVEVLGNAVDLGRFRPRSALPQVPRRALVFSNSATEEVYLPLVRSVCTPLGISLDVIGRDAGAPMTAPEERLGNYDLIFASGRCALEALAIGAAVIVCDESALAGMVTTKDLGRMRALNFGLRLIQNPLRAETLRHEIERYDRADAMAVSESIRSTAGVERVVDRLEQLYRLAIEGQRESPPKHEAEALAEATYMQWLKSVVSEREDLTRQVHLLESQRDRLRSMLERTRTDRDALDRTQSDLADRRRVLEDEQRVLEHRYRALVADDEARRAELAAMKSTATWQLRRRMLSLPRTIRAPVRLVLRGARPRSPQDRMHADNVETPER